MDFTLRKYIQLIEGLAAEGYVFLPYREFFDAHGKIVCMRHDVDKKPFNSLSMAKSEAKMGVRATYYFRAVNESWNEEVIREIASSGHEIGYHYESLTTCNGDVEKAYEDFGKNLERLRKLSQVETICMHGSPKSQYDSKDLWKHFDYKSLGVIAEPYLDTDWSDTFYLTDTGRRWDGFNVSVRDKIPHWQEVWNEKGLSFHSTDEIINNASKLPSKILITTHPQRWNDKLAPWTIELILQNIKNVIKRYKANGI
ncbi:MAG: hypothetical protein MJ002_05415 [Paludibacteraceae bacterium]|nr:hypothetical protein [Paludibacteraceae bacterium]